MKRAFISFDFDHDAELRDALKGQPKNSNSPFEIVDASVRRHLPGNWEKKVRNRIRRADLVIVICGEYTHKAEGVAAEVRIAQEEDKPYFLLRGRRDKTCTRPRTALDDDEIQEWTWDNLRRQIEGRNFREWLETPTPWIIVAGVGFALWILSRKHREPRY